MDIFSKKSSAHFESTDINGVIAETVTFVKSSLQASGTEIEFFPDESLPPTVTSRDTLKQILINLFKNAAEAMPEGGKVEVRTRWLVGDDDKPTEKTRDALEIVVDDNGPGIPLEILKDLYKPFVSTKKSGHSGLGLSIAQKAVKDLGGTISCVNKPTGGTAFTLTLPIRK
jgi:signal transduction histidine kinase